ncbi:hypothetical protein GCM10027299_09420 [Larkinella ripae]
MGKLKQFWNFGTGKLLDPIYTLPFVSIPPDLARLMDTVLYYLFLMALGIIATAYWGILEFTKGLSTSYKILLVCIIVISSMMCVWGFFDARFVNLMLPVWISLIAMSALSRLIRLFRGQDPNELVMNRRTWQMVTLILSCVVLVTIGAGVHSFFRGGPDTIHYLMQSQKRQEKAIERQSADLKQNKAETKQVKQNTDQLVVGLTLSLANQAQLLSNQKKTEAENARLKRQLAATNRTVNRTAATVNTVQRNQEATQAKVDTVRAVVDTVKAVVATVLPLDTIAVRDTVKVVVPAEAEQPRRKWWQRKRNK